MKLKININLERVHCSSSDVRVPNHNSRHKNITLILLLFHYVAVSVAEFRFFEIAPSCRTRTCDCGSAFHKSRI